MVGCRESSFVSCLNQSSQLRPTSGLVYTVFQIVFLNLRKDIASDEACKNVITANKPYCTYYEKLYHCQQSASICIHARIPQV